jgi:hypothetical protein
MARVAAGDIAVDGVSVRSARVSVAMVRAVCGWAEHCRQGE